MRAETPVPGSLVLYKERPARVTSAHERLQLELPNGETIKVRPKDVQMLHPGPLQSLDELLPLDGEIEAAWEILAGSTTTLEELAELAFAVHTPRTAWAAWQLVREGLLFHGTADSITVASREERTRRCAARAAEAARQQEWDEFMGRVRSRSIGAGDDRLLGDVVDMALGRSARSRVLRDLGRTESPEDAHTLLLDLGHWSEKVNPYPARLGIPMAPPALPLPPVPDETRRDLTHLRAFAIDDDLAGMADDALSFHDGRLWVHVADPASVVLPGGDVDLEARGRTAALYLPECMVPMLPMEAGTTLGLGVREVSPALSFCLDLSDRGARVVEIVPSTVRVARLTYSEVEERLSEEPFRMLQTLTDAYQASRRARGAVTLTIPEVDIRAANGHVEIRAVPPLRARVIVQEAMIMAGEATAQWAMERGLAMPFACQELGGVVGEATTLSAMYATRRLLRPRQYRTLPSRHASLGLDAYVQVTSPLRRYLDLVTHQQIRAALQDHPILGTSELIERVGAVEAVGGALRAAEQLSNRHWTLVYLLARPGWKGLGSVVDKRGRTAFILLPELGLETSMVLTDDLPLDSTVPLVLMGVSLPRLEAHLRIGT